MTIDTLCEQCGVFLPSNEEADYHVCGFEFCDICQTSFTHDKFGGHKCMIGERSAHTEEICEVCHHFKLWNHHCFCTICKLEYDPREFEGHQCIPYFGNL